MLTYWIPDKPCLLPANASHQVGVEALRSMFKMEILWHQLKGKPDFKNGGGGGGDVRDCAMSEYNMWAGGSLWYGLAIGLNVGWIPVQR
jgi:hypothetical protein